MKYLIFVGCCVSAAISLLALVLGLGSGFFVTPGIDLNVGVVAQTGLFVFVLSIIAAHRQWNLQSADLVILPVMLAAILSFAFTVMATHNAVVSSWIGAVHIVLAIVGMWYLLRFKAPASK